MTIVNYNHNRSSILKFDLIKPDDRFWECSKSAKLNAEHPATGRFSTIVLIGDECAWVQTMNSETSFWASEREQDIIYKILDLNSLTKYQRTLHTSENTGINTSHKELLKQEYFQRLQGNAFLSRRDYYVGWFFRTYLKECLPNHSKILDSDPQ